MACAAARRRNPSCGQSLLCGGRGRPGPLMLRAQRQRAPWREANMGKLAVQASEHDAVAHKDMANAIRALAMDAVEKAKSGHPGMPMGMADVATVLFTRFLKFDAAAPAWPDRDRFVLSAGHGSMLLYALLHLTGHAGMTMEEIASFRQLGSKTPGHPEHGHAPGIETTTGPLGQGLANAVGMALAERLVNARLGDQIIDHFTYVVVGDGCLMEGISQEAISYAVFCLKKKHWLCLFSGSRGWPASRRRARSDR